MNPSSDVLGGGGINSNSSASERGAPPTIRAKRTPRATSSHSPFSIALPSPQPSHAPIPSATGGRGGGFTSPQTGTGSGWGPGFLTHCEDGSAASSSSRRAGRGASSRQGEQQREIGDLLRLQNAAVPFQHVSSVSSSGVETTQATESAAPSPEDGGDAVVQQREEAGRPSVMSNNHGSAASKKKGKKKGAPQKESQTRSNATEKAGGNEHGDSVTRDRNTCSTEEDALLVEALAQCDGLSDTSTISGDLTMMGSTATQAPDDAVKARRWGKKRSKTTQQASSTRGGMDSQTADILAWAQDIAEQQEVIENHSLLGGRGAASQRSDSLLHVHVHTRIRSKLMAAEGRYGTPSCWATNTFPLLPSASVGKTAVPTIGDVVAVAAGTTAGFVLLFDSEWRVIGELKMKAGRSVDALSISTDRTTLICSQRRRFCVWSLDVRCPSAASLVYRSSSSVFDTALMSLQHLGGLQRAFIAVEEHQGTVHLCSLTNLLGRPFFLHHQVVVPCSLLRPTTCVDTLPCPTLDFFHRRSASEKGGNVTTALLTVFGDLRREEEEQRHRTSKLWWGSSSSTTHLVAIANVHAVSLYLCGLPSMEFTILVTWEFPQVSKYSPLVHFSVFETDQARHLTLAVGSEGALRIFDVQPHVEQTVSGHSPVEQDESVSRLRLRGAMPWNPAAAIVGLWAVGNGNLLVIDTQQEISLVDALVGVTLEQLMLPSQSSAVCGLFGVRAGSIPPAVVIPQGRRLDVLLYTGNKFVISFTLLTWQERLDGMIRRRQFTRALECIGETLLEGGLSTHGASHSEGGMQGCVVLTYTEMICILYLEETLERANHIQSSSGVEKKVRETFHHIILSSCQHEQMRRVFWERFLPFVEEHHADVLPAALCAVVVHIESRKIAAVPAKFIPALVLTLVRKAIRDNCDNSAVHGEEEEEVLEKLDALSFPIRDKVEAVLLKLKGDIPALYAIAQKYRFHRLSVNISAFHWHKYPETLHDLLREYTCQRADVALEYVSRLMFGKTFVDTVDIEPEMQGSAQRQVLRDLYHLPSILTRLLEHNAAKTVELLLLGVCQTDMTMSSGTSNHKNSSSNDSSCSRGRDRKRRTKVWLQRDDAVHPVRFALRIFVALLLLYESTESQQWYTTQYTEDEMTEPAHFMPLLRKYVRGVDDDGELNELEDKEELGTAADYQCSRITAALQCYTGILLQHTAARSIAENQSLGYDYTWCALLPILLQTCLRLFQISACAAARRQAQVALSAYLRSPHLSRTSLTGWKRRLQFAGMSRCVATICFRDGQYGEGIDVYLDADVIDDPTLPKEMFDFLHQEMISLMVEDVAEPAKKSPNAQKESSAKIDALRCAVIDRVVPLGKVDRRALAAFYLNYPPKSEENLFKALDHRKLLGFLQQLISSGDDALLGNQRVQDQYIKLLCIHAPHKVHAYLRDHDIAFSEEAALECSRKFHVDTATIFLLAKQRRLEEAVECTRKTMLRLLNAAVDGMPREFENEKTDDGRSRKRCVDEVLDDHPQLREVLELGVDVGKTANNERTWIQLVKLFDPSCRGSEKPYYHLLCEAGLAVMMRGLSQCLGSGPLFHHILQHVSVPHWSRALPNVVTMLTVEKALYESANGVAEKDGMAMTTQYLSTARHAVMGKKAAASLLSSSLPVSAFPCCCLCHQSLQQREGGHFVDALLCVFSCGHGYHEECLSREGRPRRSCVECKSSGVLHEDAEPDKERSGPSTVSDTVLEDRKRRQYQHLKRVRGFLDNAGERSRVMRNMLSALPKPVSRPPQVVPPVKSTQHPRLPSREHIPLPPRHVQEEWRWADEGNPFDGFTSEDFLSLFGNDIERL